MALRPTPASRARTATVSRQPFWCRGWIGRPWTRRSSASRNLVSLASSRFSYGLILAAMLIPHAVVERGQDAVAFRDARRRQRAAAGVERRLVEQLHVARPPRFPDRPMPGGHREVG